MNPKQQTQWSTRVALLVFCVLAINPVVVFLILDRPILSVVFTVATAGVPHAAASM